jgi:hypothetical protein
MQRREGSASKRACTLRPARLRLPENKSLLLMAIPPAVKSWQNLTRSAFCYRQCQLFSFLSLSSSLGKSTFVRVENKSQTFASSYTNTNSNVRLCCSSQSWVCLPCSRLKYAESLSKHFKLIGEFQNKPVFARVTIAQEPLF